MTATTPAPVRVDARAFAWRPSGRLAWALTDLDLSIEPGERVLLLGPSGSGKSTLLRSLAGVVGEDEGDARGTLLVDGEPPRPGRAGLVLQDPDAQVILARIGDDVAFGAENLGVPRDELWPRVHAALDAVGLDLPLDRSTSALSGGQKQRLALAGVIAMRPGLVLLDEPTANLDPQGVADVREAVERVLDRTGATLIVVEHRVDVWLGLVDRIIVLDHDGTVRADGAPDAVLAADGASLAGAGVWVPGHDPVLPERRRALQSGPLIEATELVVGRAHPVQSIGQLTVERGRCLALTGANGSGKSTLALTLAGLLPPIAGSLEATPALADGLGAAPIRWRSRELVSRIGSVFQSPEHQFLASTVRAELELGPHAIGLDAASTTARVDELLERLRLDRLERANPFTLSGGEQRRLSVATALATRPSVLVLDEPTFGQDARTWSELVALLAGLIDEGSAVVAATHDAAFVEAIADVSLRLELA